MQNIETGPRFAVNLTIVNDVSYRQTDLRLYPNQQLRLATDAFIQEFELTVTKMHTIHYDTIEEFNVDRKAECGQLDLAHVAKNNTKETKTNKRQCPALSPVQVQDPS